MSQRMKLAAAVGLALMLVGCASTSFQSTWKNPAAAPVLKEKGATVVAVVMAEDKYIRQGAEDELARELTKRGYKGVASYTIVPPEATDEAAVRAVFEKMGAKAVVAMRPLATDQEGAGRDRALYRGMNARIRGPHIARLPCDQSEGSEVHMASAYDEMYEAGSVVTRAHYGEFERWLSEQSPETMRFKRAEADLVFRRVGITFAVYGDDAGTERLIPFDVVPRIIPACEWRQLEAGLKQRVRALNRFIHDFYHEQDIERAGRNAAEQVFRNSQYRPEMHGVHVPGGIYSHISGIDVVRAGQGEFYVLEDNLFPHERWFRSIFISLASLRRVRL